ncbi:MAG: serine hydrolase [Chloroflexi bacterium AL-W]|nr:serine hydrolase [Chloroflexi bacterium AL-N1]NOK67450.1 serine hydrolase [Chloroflexi bacterium AL-N10]NOK75058.1 serine hydrolase [Chloroflexi bacterium AL-N5]NOK81845.1 serine hydrolase [Chloroflexi bacterium AL-W]NOK89691.1 serine hydrolase [Chloroflexi bacterium AL-N15]
MAICTVRWHTLRRKGVFILDLPIKDRVRQAAEQMMANTKVPGVVVVVARPNEPTMHLAVGVDGLGRPLAADSLFPVASVTKLATALATLRLVDAGLVDLDDLLRDHLPYAVAAHSDVTIRSLLSHTSGLPVELAAQDVTYAVGLDWEKLGQACLQTGLEALPDTRVQYSNVGYGLLALVLEHYTNQLFSDALTSLVLEPLRIEGYLGVEPPDPAVTIAGVRSSHTGTMLEPFNSAFWRGLALPWAGLLTNADGALALVRAFQGFPHGFLAPQTVAIATANQSGDLGGGLYPPLMWERCPWGLGPELRADKTPHWAPEQASPASFGHSGASGCLVWADPMAEVAWAILGSQTADNGWLLRRSGAISSAILAG